MPDTHSDTVTVYRGEWKVFVLTRTESNKLHMCTDEWDWKAGRQAAQQSRSRRKGGSLFIGGRCCCCWPSFSQTYYRYIDSVRNKFLIACRFPFPFLSFLPAQAEEGEDTTSTALEKSSCSSSSSEGICKLVQQIAAAARGRHSALDIQSSVPGIIR